MLSIIVLLDTLFIACLLTSGHSSTTDKLQPYVVVKANANLPSCINITEDSHRKNTTGLTKSDNTKGNDEREGNSRNFTIENPDRFTTCFPLSPQLRHCKTTTLVMGEYKTENHTLVYGADKNLTATLGDYYIDANGTALVCEQWINATKVKLFPRCHYLNLHPEDYEINKNGGFYLKAASSLVEQPIHTVNIQEKTANICFPLSIEFLNCPLKGVFPPSEYSIQQDLTLKLRGSDKGLQLSEHYFHTTDTDAVACIPDDSNQYACSRFVAKIYAIFFLLSAIALLLTLIVKIRSSKNNCHDKCLICHIASLLIFTVLASIRRFTIIWPSVCHLFFAIVYLTVMAAYLWLNVVAFDTWHSFNRLPRASSSRRRISEQCKFRCYMMYAFGIPVIIVAFILILDQNRGLQDTLAIFPTIIGQCWLNDTASLWAFYNGPLIVIMGINLIFFVLTMIGIYKAGKGTDLVNRKRKKQLLIICIKLFVVMGICWLIDGILVSVQDYLPFFYWYISDATDALQGFAIFVVLVVCNKKTYNTIRSHISARNMFFRKKNNFLQNKQLKHRAPIVQRQSSNTTVTTQLSMDIPQ